MIRLALQTRTLRLCGTLLLWEPLQPWVKPDSTTYQQGDLEQITAPPQASASMFVKWGEASTGPWEGLNKWQTQSNTHGRCHVIYMSFPPSQRRSSVLRTPQTRRTPQTWARPGDSPSPCGLPNPRNTALFF